MRTKIIVISLVVVIILAVLAIVLIPRMNKPQQTFTPTYWPTEGWLTSTPEEQGLDSVKLTEAIEQIQKQHIPINSLMIIRNGMVVLDTYFYNPYDGKYPHDLASVTKSIMTTLIGIAAGQGKIDLDKPMLSYFPDRTIANMDERKEHITVRNLAGNVNGMESGCLPGDEPTIRAMISTSDWVQHALDRKMVQEPGKTFCYDSPGMHLLSAILQESTGMTALEFARQYLFAPLGIKEAIWEGDPQGYTRGWGDLHLYPQDAAKIGFLFQNQGKWNGEQIVPADWVEQAVIPQVNAGDDDYGYGWWISESSYGANGRGGQRIYVVPSLNAIVVTTGGGFEYDQIDPYISASVIDPVNPLPANPVGVARLEAALGTLVRDLPTLPGVEAPEIVQRISGKTFIFEPNPAMLEHASLDFSDPAEVAISLRLLGNDVTWKVGLDGQYRQSPEGSLQRGYWKDAQTFVIEVFDVGMSQRTFTFTDDQVRVEAEGMTINGEMENPEQPAAQIYWPTNGWQTSTPEAQGFDSDKLADALLTMQRNKLNVDSLLIIRNGNVILDAYFYPYDHTINHNLASVTKSFTTTLIGMAIDQGKIELDEAMLSFFPNRKIANVDSRKERITIRDLVSNMNGYESGCLHGDVSTLSKMRSGPDYIQHALDRKVVDEPGTRFCYDSPGMHLLSAILQEATGMTELDFARKYLFKPLGIEEAYWKSDPQGYTYGWGDLYLKPLDAAKLGYLWLNKGVWDNQQIISQSWVEDSVKKNIYAGIDYYGYGWWVADDNYYALGRLGQYVKVFPSLNAIVVITAHGFDYDDIAQLLDATFIDAAHPLPENSAGEAKLQETVASLGLAPHPWQTDPLPDSAKAISGKTYVFDPNPLKLASIQLMFSDNTEATLNLNLEGQDMIWPIGLDGEYRVEPNGRGLRGYWAEPQTFVIEIFQDGLESFQLHILEDGIQLDSQSLSIKGQEKVP